MILRIVGIVLVIILLIGIYSAFTNGGLHRCNYSEATQDTECYDPR
jgi:hypothetical protein